MTYWTDDDILAAMHLRESLGWSGAKIARVLKRSRSGVVSMLWRIEREMKGDK